MSLYGLSDIMLAMFLDTKCIWMCASELLIVSGTMRDASRSPRAIIGECSIYSQLSHPLIQQFCRFTRVFSELRVQFN